MNSTDPNLTEPERKLVDHLRSLNGRSASYREIAEALGWTSVRTVGYHVENLERKGVVDRGQHRGLRLAPRFAPVAPSVVPIVPRAKARTLPIYGEVAAGEPIFSGGDPPEELDLDKVFRGDDVFLLKVRGDSMIEEHIADGDLVAVQKNPEVTNGKIVVVRIDGAHTLKRIRVQNGTVVLLPRNRKFEPREIKPYEDAEVIGGYLGILRLPK